MQEGGWKTLVFDLTQIHFLTVALCLWKTSCISSIQCTEMSWVKCNSSSRRCVHETAALLTVSSNILPHYYGHCRKALLIFLPPSTFYSTPISSAVLFSDRHYLQPQEQWSSLTPVKFLHAPYFLLQKRWLKFLSSGVHRRTCAGTFSWRYNLPLCVCELYFNKFQELEVYLSLDPIRDSAGDKPVVTLPIILYSVDMSGNKSKEWHEFNNLCLMLAGLPRHLNSQLSNIHLTSFSDSVSTLQMVEPIADKLILLENEGMEVFDAHLNQKVHVTAPLLLCICDNPRASELLTQPSQH